MILRGLCATCGKGPRPLSYRLRAGRSCSTCYQAKKYGRTRRIDGAVCRCGCGRPARGQSGYAHPCYVALWRRTRFFQTVTGTEMPLITIAEALEQLDPRMLGLAPSRAESLRAAAALIRAVVEGRITLQRKPRSRRTATGFTGWRRSRRSYNRKSPLRLVG